MITGIEIVIMIGRIHGVTMTMMVTFCLQLGFKLPVFYTFSFEMLFSRHHFSLHIIKFKLSWNFCLHIDQFLNFLTANSIPIVFGVTIYHTKVGQDRFACFRRFFYTNKQTPRQNKNIKYIEELFWLIFKFDFFYVNNKFLN